MSISSRNFQSSLDIGGENRTNDENYIVLDQYMPHQDVVRIAYSMYGRYIDSGDFFNEREVLDDSFSVQENLQPLFEDLG